MGEIAATFQNSLLTPGDLIHLLSEPERQLPGHSASEGQAERLAGSDVDSRIEWVPLRHGYGQALWVDSLFGVAVLALQNGVGEAP